MEPDVLATPSESLVHGAEATGRRTDPVFSLSNDGMSVTVAPAYTTQTSSPRPAALNGHAMNGTNGHAVEHANGHTWKAVPAVAPLGPAAAYVPSLAHPAHRLVHREHGFYLRVGKRALDVIGSLVALILTSPALLLTALLIKLDSRGPVLYKSTRIGRGGKPFTFYKLRSMVADADRHRHHLTHLNEADGPVFKISNDPRVTRIGRFLRTTSIDEIPQFLNVLNGDMSLVGPRPPIPQEVAQYEPLQMRRLDVRPGITCLWQISGRSRIGFQEWMRLDLEYIKHRSFALDLKILLRTIPAVLSREGAY